MIVIAVDIRIVVAVPTVGNEVVLLAVAEVAGFVGADGGVWAVPYIARIVGVFCFLVVDPGFSSGEGGVAVVVECAFERRHGRCCGVRVDVGEFGVEEIESVLVSKIEVV